MPPDTSADAHAVQCEIYRRLGGRRRLDVMFGLSDTVRRLAVSGIRARHPDYTSGQVRQAYARLLLGDALTATIWPNDELVDP